MACFPPSKQTLITSVCALLRTKDKGFEIYKKRGNLVLEYPNATTGNCPETPLLNMCKFDIN